MALGLQDFDIFNLKNFFLVINNFSYGGPYRDDYNKGINVESTCVQCLMAVETICHMLAIRLPLGSFFGVLKYSPSSDSKHQSS